MNKSQAVGYKIGIDISRKFWQQSLIGKAWATALDIRGRLFPRYAKFSLTMSVAQFSAYRHAWQWVQENLIEDAELFRLFETVLDTLNRLEEDTDVMRSAFISTGSHREALEIMFGFMEQRVREVEAKAELLEEADSVRDESTISALMLVKALERWATTKSAKDHAHYAEVCDLIKKAREADDDEELKKVVSKARMYVYGL